MSNFFMEPPEWRPVIDGYVLPYTYGEALRSGAHADIPILTGNNAEESGASMDEGFSVATYKSDWREVFGSKFYKAFLHAYPAANASQADDSANELFRDMSRVGTWQWANAWAAGGAHSKVYTYYWTHAPPVNGDQGAYHGSELWYVFNNIPYSAEYASANWTATDLAIEKTMTKYWANFIRSGNPNGDGLVHFPPSTNASLQTMWLGNSWGAGPVSESTERVAFIEKWYSTLNEW
jgi:carboxylesterase 2